MPSLRTFGIEFDRPGATYVPGDIVCGNVIVDLSSQKSVRGMYVVAKGEANVAWSERKRKRNVRGETRTKTEYHTNNEHYFTLNYNVMGRPGGDARVEIPMGYNKYPFSFQLPQNIPSSFEHNYGHIRYTIKAVIDRPWKFDHECKAAFTVVSSLDLNSHQNRCYGIDDDVHESFCCFCCFDMGSINAEIKIPSSGYVPGQSIDTIVSFNNSSRVDVTKICTKLQRCLKFHARSTTKKVTSEVHSNKTKRPFGKRDEVISRLQIPPIPPSDLQYCEIIDLNYNLEVCIHVSGPHCKVSKSYPILIGTVPLRCTPSAPPLLETTTLPTAGLTSNIQKDPVSVPMPMPMPPSTIYPADQFSTGGSYNPPQTSNPIGFVSRDQPGTSSSQWDIPPPSYEECVSGTSTIRDHNESDYVHGANQPFAPRYPVFNLPAPHVPNS